MPLGYCVAVKKTVDRLKFSNHNRRIFYRVQVSRYMEHGNRRGVTLALCRRRTV